MVIETKENSYLKGSLKNMTEKSSKTDCEIVGLFENRKLFDAAVDALLKSGIERYDISVLSDHESLEITAEPDSEGEEIMTATLGEMKYIAPLTTAGFIALAAGPIVAPIAALIAGTVGALALSDFVVKLTADEDGEDIAKEIKLGGILLWVHVEDEKTHDNVKDIMEKSGGKYIHDVNRDDYSDEVCEI